MQPKVTSEMADRYEEGDPRQQLEFGGDEDSLRGASPVHRSTPSMGRSNPERGDHPGLDLSAIGAYG